MTDQGRGGVADAPAPERAGQIARAIVAAAGVMRYDPQAAFERKGRGTRILAAIGMVRALGLSRIEVARWFQLAAPELSPSGLATKRITDDEIGVVIAALNGLSPTGTIPDAATGPAAPQEDGGSGGTVVEVALATAAGVMRWPVARVQESQGRRTRILAAAGVSAALGWAKTEAARAFQVAQQDLAPSVLRQRRISAEDLRTVAEALRRAGHERVAPLEKPVAAGSKPRRPGRERSRSSVPEMAGVRVLKPVSPRVVRWARQQVRLGADPAFVAWCFDVDETALRAALQAARRHPLMARAA